MEIKFGGLSQDQRTNKWVVICDCGKRFSPLTTRLSTQVFQCPKCNRDIFADYNAEPTVVKYVVCGE